MHIVALARSIGAFRRVVTITCATPARELQSFGSASTLRIYFLHVQARAELRTE
jgi:hypothetical protein